MQARDLSANSTPSPRAQRLLPPIDGGSYHPYRVFVIRRGGIEIAGLNGQDLRPYGGVRLVKAGRVHQSGRRARRAQQGGGR